MKTAKKLFGILTITLAFAIKVHSQIYQLSTSMSGTLTLGTIADANGPPGSSSNLTLNLNTLTETAYVDTANSTVRQVGTISCISSPTNIQFQETQGGILGTVTVNLAPSGGTLSFDTGTVVYPVSVEYSDGWPGGPPYFLETNYEINFGPPVLSSIPMSGSYSLVTGGQTYAGSFSYTMQWNTDGDLYPYDLLSLTGVSVPLQPGYPFAVELDDYGIDGEFIWGYGTPGLVADVKAANGFEMQLSISGECQLNWSAPGAVATNISGIPPSITTQPQSMIVHANDTAPFIVTASGVLPLNYQWSLNGSNISGANYSTLTIVPVTQTNLGTYTVVVANAYGSQTSSIVTLSMYPSIVSSFAGAITYWGKDATLSVGVWGTEPLSYQWYQNGVAIPNATNQDLAFSSIQFTNAGLYSVVVTNSLGSVTNPPAQVIVEPAGVSLGFSPTITINGVVGYNYVIQGSTNLANSNGWVTVTNLTLTQPVQIWVDTNVDASSPFNSMHFYQVLPGQ